MTANPKLLAKEDAGEFSNFLVSYMATHFRHEIDHNGCILWFKSMEGQCTLDQFYDAMVEYSKQATRGKIYQPIPADILARISGGTQNQDAWKKVTYAVKHFGSHYSMSFDDNRIHYAITSLGGWPSFCVKLNQVSEGKRSENELHKEFMTLYSAGGEFEGKPLIGSLGTGSPMIRINQQENGSLKIAQVRPRLIQARSA